MAAARTSSPCYGSRKQASAGEVGRRKLTGHSVIITNSHSAWTLNARGPRSQPCGSVRDAEELLAAVIRRRTGQPHQLKQTSQTVLNVLDTLGALVPRAPEAPRPPHHWWPSWWQGARVLHGTSTSRPT